MKSLIFVFIASLISLNIYASDKNICGTTDDRVLSNNQKVARGTNLGFSSGCTITMIGKSCAISAGHCVGSLEVISFNIPLSGDRFPLRSTAEDTYYREKDFLKSETEGSGKDWVVFRILKNKITGLYPGEAQGFYKVRLDKKVSVYDMVRITGHGRDENDNYKNLAQQTHIGPIQKVGSIFKKSVIGYEVDTMGGNSGSSIVLESTNEIIGVHTHGTCKVKNGANLGTLISKHKEFKQVIKECLAWEKTLSANN